MTDMALGIRELIRVTIQGCFGIALCAGLAAAGEPQMGEPLPFPHAPRRALAVKAESAAPPSGFTWVNTDSREEARVFYNTVYVSSDHVPMQWNGAVSGCQAGTNASAYLRAVARRINYYRAMAGVPAGIAFSADQNRQAQQAALMYHVNDALSHFPPVTWSCYTEEGAAAARNSNISLGTAGPEAVLGQMRDHGLDNTAVGHRRWLLYPQTQVMGSGNVPASGVHPAANANWVFDDHIWAPRPDTREEFVAWPPPGYVPYPVVYPRWSFSDAGADFSSASVSMTSNGVSLAVRVEPVATGFGENTLVWVPGGLNASSHLTTWPKPSADTTYEVTIRDVLFEMRLRSFSYTVRVFDPLVPSVGAQEPVVSGPARPVVGQPNIYSFAPVALATGYQWRQSQVLPYTAVEGGESGLAGLQVNVSSGYSVLVSSPVASGLRAFHLVHPGPPSDQWLALKPTFLPGANATLQFKSVLGYATPSEIAKVQLSLDDGASWQDAYSQPGNNSTQGTTYETRTVSLSSYAHRAIRVRFNYAYTGGAYYPQTDWNVGWLIDDIQFTNTREMRTNAPQTVVSGTNFVFTPGVAGEHTLEVRAVVYQEFPLEWSPVLLVTGTHQPLIRIASPLVVTGSQVRFDFTITNASVGLTYQVEKAATLSGPWQVDPAASVQTLTPNSIYRVTTPRAGATTLYRVVGR
jgi:hypothetical protein